MGEVEGDGLEGKMHARWKEQHQRQPVSGGVEDEAKKGQMARVLKARLKQALPSDRNERMP